MTQNDLIAFEQNIHQNWADSFHCQAATLSQPGTTLLPDEKYATDKVVIIWHIGKHAFVQFAPQYADAVIRALGGLPDGAALSGDDLLRVCPAGAIKSHDVGLVYYLFPPDLPPCAPDSPFVLRQLTKADESHIQALHAANTPEDVEEGFVEVDHEIVFGCFLDDQLAAAASGYTRTGFMDIGVLTHPGFRQKGLGKAAVGALCEWSIRKDVIAQYRHNVLNQGSQGVARSLNFRPYFKSEAIWMA